MKPTIDKRIIGLLIKEIFNFNEEIKWSVAMGHRHYCEFLVPHLDEHHLNALSGISKECMVLAEHRQDGILITIMDGKFVEM